MSDQPRTDTGEVERQSCVNQLRRMHEAQLGSPNEHKHFAYAADQLDYNPPCPAIEPIKAIAKELGYNAIVHGSLIRDFDVVAVPWEEKAIAPADLIKQMVARLTVAYARDVRCLEVEHKPLGRLACTLQVDGWSKPIDLSIAPIVRG